jgi:hypothetical protein
LTVSGFSLTREILTGQAIAQALIRKETIGEKQKATRKVAFIVNEILRADGYLSERPIEIGNEDQAPPRPSPSSIIGKALP